MGTTERDAVPVLVLVDEAKERGFRARTSLEGTMTRRSRDSGPQSNNPLRFLFESFISIKNERYRYALLGSVLILICVVVAGLSEGLPPWASVALGIGGTIAILFLLVKNSKSGGQKK